MAPSVPERCDVLVVGAGPAGCACALHLARAGLDVWLVDAAPRGRDKVCGDGLIPDAHAALARLGLLDDVLGLARSVPAVRCIGPRGGALEVPGRLAVLPRSQLDALLAEAACRAGAHLAAPVRFEAPRLADGRVVGARLAVAGGTCEVHARWVVLATGAQPAATLAAGMCTRRGPSGIALRGYIRHPQLAESLQALEVVWHRHLAGGYGWIFPAPDGMLNVGVGLTNSHRHGADGRHAMQDVNLRAMLGAFLALHPTARRLRDEGRWTAPPKGAPLRCSLDGATWSRPGLLVTGEAAGSTYAFTGEGIGKAMQTGLAAAEALVGAFADEAADAQACRQYDSALATLKPRYDLYERANRVNRHPWIADFLIARGRRNRALVHRMAGVLEETSNPGHLLSLAGLAKLLLPIEPAPPPAAS